MYTSNVQAKFTGDFALFIRPENKVERVSYPIMTPSAARDALEAIFWKLEMEYRIRSITVLQRPVFYSILRNEVSKKASVTSKFMNQPKDMFTDDIRQLRHSLVLKNVAYIVEATILSKSNSLQAVKKYEAMFQRRLLKGQCFYNLFWYKGVFCSF